MTTITLTGITHGYNADPSSVGTVEAGTYDRLPDWDGGGAICIDIGEEGLQPFWIVEDDEAIEGEESQS